MVFLESSCQEGNWQFSPSALRRKRSYASDERNFSARSSVALDYDFEITSNAQNKKQQSMF